MATNAKWLNKGFAEYLEKIARAGQDVDAGSQQALGAAGEILLAGMQKRAPKDTHNLEQKLAIDGPHQDGNRHTLEVGLLRRGPHKADADTARYGTAQEFGSASMAAQPYVRPTLKYDFRKARVAMRTVFERLFPGVFG